MLVPSSFRKEGIAHYLPYAKQSHRAHLHNILENKDRAHRIDQNKPVVVYRLLTTGSVEARIHALQERKQKLTDSVLQEQKADNIRFSLEDLTSLFAPVNECAPAP